MTSCPTLQTPGPKYYKLETYSKSKSEPAGTFNDPLTSSEAELCTENVSGLTESERELEREREREREREMYRSMNLLKYRYIILYYVDARSLTKHYSIVYIGINSPISTNGLIFHHSTGNCILFM